MNGQEIINSIGKFFMTNAAMIFEIIIVVILALLVLRLIQASRSRIEAKIIENRIEPNQQPRLKTLLRAGLSTSQVLVICIAVLMILQIIGINIAPVLASVGIAGLAISLGAQTLIKDYIGGIIILFENQFNVGDVIEVDNVAGTVERIELRSTYVRDLTGKLYNIPNGDIRIHSNNTRGWSRAVVDFNIPFDTDTSKVVEALKKGIAEASQDEILKPLLLEEPQIQGWNNMSEWAVQVRLSVKTPPGKQFTAATILRKYALEALQNTGISLALPPSAHQ